MAKTLSNEHNKGTWYVGTVVDNKDPDFEGKCRIRVFGLFDNLEDSELPWARPANRKMFASSESGGFADISVPKVGTVLRVQFTEGDIYSPEYFGIYGLNSEVKNEISESYENSHVLCFDTDEELRVLYSPAKGMTIVLKGSQITINPDSSVTIEHKDSESIIELVGTTINIVSKSTINLTSNSLIRAESTESILNGTALTKLGPSPIYSGVLAEPLWIFLKALATAVDSKMPSSPGVLAAQAEVFEQLSTSKNVKIS